jgi:hypothetical protein
MAFAGRVSFGANRWDNSQSIEPNGAVSQLSQSRQKQALADEASGWNCRLRKISTKVHLASGTPSQRRKIGALAIAN